MASRGKRRRKDRPRSRPGAKKHGATNLLDELRLLSAESTVMVELLAENAVLVRMIKEGQTHAACLHYVNTNY